MSGNHHHNDGNNYYGLPAARVPPHHHQQVIPSDEADEIIQQAARGAATPAELLTLRVVFLGHPIMQHEFVRILLWIFRKCVVDNPDQPTCPPEIGNLMVRFLSNRGIDPYLVRVDDDDDQVGNPLPDNDDDNDDDSAVDDETGPQGLGGGGGSHWRVANPEDIDKSAREWFQIHQAEYLRQRGGNPTAPVPSITGNDVYLSMNRHPVTIKFCKAVKTMAYNFATYPEWDRVRVMAALKMMLAADGINTFYEYLDTDTFEPCDWNGQWYQVLEERLEEHVKNKFLAHRIFN